MFTSKFFCGEIVTMSLTNVLIDGWA